MDLLYASYANEEMENQTKKHSKILKMILFFHTSAFFALPVYYLSEVFKECLGYFWSKY